ncbi:MAG: TonB-dependent receptor [Gallionella sp.]|nr:TonB-dependent receptor [Gallionella sp.]
MLSKKQITFSLLLLACRAVYAADSSSEMDYYQEFPVVLSASRLSQPLSEAPNAMTVIDRKMIVASGFRTIPDLFKLVPGMYVGYYKGSQPFVSYHGSPDQYARRMQVMIDGRSIYMPPASTVDWANLPITIEDIERIEVIRGPAAASHGANSTQGVISIATRDAGGAEGKQLSITRGSKGVNDVSARYGKRGDVFDYRMTLAYTADNGFDNLTTPPNNYPLTKFKATSLLNNSNDSNQARLLNYRADYHPNGIDRYDVQLGLNRDVQTVGWTDSVGNPVHDLLSNSTFLQLGWIRLLDDAAELSMHYYHMEQRQHEAFTVVTPAVQSSDMSRDEIELQHTLHLSDVNRLVYGAAWRNDRLAAQGYAQALFLIYGAAPSYSSSSNTHEYRLFAHDEWRITPQLLLNTGGMIEGDGMGHQDLSPRIALNYHLSPMQTVRMGMSVAYRTPASAESRFRVLQPGALFVPNATVNSPGLMPERMLSRELGYLGEFPDLSTSLDLRLFSDQLSNGIFYDKTFTGTFVNGMSVLYQGFEATLKHAFNENSDLSVNFAHELASSNGPAMLAAGYTGFISSAPWTNDSLSGNTPRNSASLLYALRLPHDYAFSTAFYYQDAMQPFDRGVIDFQPIQRRMDARIAKTFNQGGGVKGEVALVLQNLFDAKYTDYVANNAFNRRGYATLTLNW